MIFDEAGLFDYRERSTHGARNSLRRRLMHSGLSLKWCRGVGEPFGDSGKDAGRRRTPCGASRTRTQPGASRAAENAQPFLRRAARTVFPT